MVEANFETKDKIGYLLLKKGIIDTDILEQALQVKTKDNGKIKKNLAQILVDDFEFDHDLIFREVALLYAFKEINLNPDKISEERLNSIKNTLDNFCDQVKDLIFKHRVIPFKSNGKIILAAVDPTDKALTKIAFTLNAKKYDVNYLKKHDYDKLIQKILPPENKYLKALEEAEEEIDVDEPEETDLDEEELEAEINKSALVNLIEASLVEGVRRGVSDIHYIPRSNHKTDIYFRQDGKLLHWHTQEGTLPEAVIAVVKDRARNMDRFERESAQDGFIQREIDGTVIRYRVSVLPMVGTELRNKFETIVVRILDDRKVIKDIDKLGLTGYAKKVFNKSINQPQGMVILTGPTGSGKSTTLVAALYQVVSPEVNVLTVEDPVEYVIEGARQLKIGNKMDFEQAIRSILRHDPDIVLVGEMRDKVTAETAIKLANTGHLTFSTLHTNDAPSAVARLYKMGIEPFLIGYAINLIVAQRLVRKLCDNCKKRVENFDEETMEAAGLNIEEWENYEIYEPVGCDECNHTGYKGRMAIHEALYFTKDIKNLIVKAGTEIDEEKVREQARKDGTLSLREAGFEKVKLGLTSIQEVVATTMEE